MNLDECYEMYKEKKQTLATLKDDVMSYAYERAGRDKYIEPGDFILKFIPGIDSIISRYQPEKASFSHYINQHMKWMMYSFRKEYIEKKEKDDLYQSYYCSNPENIMSLAEEPINYGITDRALQVLRVDKKGGLQEPVRKRLEIFTLKNTRFLTDNQINKLAPLIGRSTDWIYKMKEKLDECSIKRVANREYLIIRHNRLFIEIARDQRKIAIVEDLYEKEKLLQKNRERKEVKERINTKLRKRHCGPRNEEIAKLLGIPKGTVDSSLFYIKDQLRVLLPDFKDFD